MIVNIGDKVFRVAIPRKCGSSSIINIFAYRFLKRVSDKRTCRICLSKNSKVFHMGDFYRLEKEFISNNDIKIDCSCGIVRDPIKRFVSAYQDRVLKKNKDGFKSLGLDWVIDSIDKLISDDTDIGRHLLPQVWWLGDTWQEYDYIFDIKEINTAFKRVIEKHTDERIPNVIENVSFSKQQIKLTEEQVNKIRGYYSKDCELYCKYAKGDV